MTKLLAIGVATTMATAAAFSQDYPSKPIRIVTSGAASTADFAARFVAQRISGPLGQQVIVDNRGSSSIPAQIVSQAPPDGYTLLSHGGTFLLAPLLQKTPYDVVKDFSPVSSINSSPNVLVVHPSLPAKSVKELIALAKAKPGQLNYSSAGTGASTHLAAELFNSMAGINIVRVAYKSSNTQFSDLLGGHVQLTFATVVLVIPHIKSSRLRALGISSAQPSALFPNLPTIAASGLPGFESATEQNIFAPAKTPAAIITRLNREIVRILSTAETKEQFLNIGAEAVTGSPEELATKIKADIAKWGKIIKDAGIKIDD